jgi:hypothetical protein
MLRRIGANKRERHEANLLDASSLGPLGTIRRAFFFDAKD